MEETAATQEQVLASLVARGILKRDQKRLLPETVQHLWVFRSPRYFVVDAKAKRAPEIRLVDALFSDEIPDVRDVALSCLVDACNILPVLFGERAVERAAPRIELLRNMDLDRKGDKRRGRRHRAFESSIDGASAGLTPMGALAFVPSSALRHEAVPRPAAAVFTPDPVKTTREAAPRQGPESGRRPFPGRESALKRSEDASMAGNRAQRRAPVATDPVQVVADSPLLRSVDRSSLGGLESELEWVVVDEREVLRFDGERGDALYFRRFRPPRSCPAPGREKRRRGSGGSRRRAGNGGNHRRRRHR